MANDTDVIGLFLPNTYLVDVEQLREVNVQSPEFKELLVRLYQDISDMVEAINKKDTGQYLVQQFVTGSLFFNVNNDINNLRPIYRIVVNCGALPNTTIKSIPHGISPTDFTSAWTFLKIYGAASNTSSFNYIPLPYVSSTSLADNIEIDVDNTNVYITTGANYSAYTQSYIILEFIKN